MTQSGGFRLGMMSFCGLSCSASAVAVQLAALLWICLADGASPLCTGRSLDLRSARATRIHILVLRGGNDSNSCISESGSSEDLEDHLDGEEEDHVLRGHTSW